jgi:hypothetical protein
MHFNTFTADISHFSYKGKKYLRNVKVSEIWADRNQKQNYYFMHSCIHIHQDKNFQKDFNIYLVVQFWIDNSNY